jgi:hypothetical protein
MDRWLHNNNTFAIYQTTCRKQQWAKNTLAEKYLYFLDKNLLKNFQ